MLISVVVFSVLFIGAQKYEIKNRTTEIFNPLGGSFPTICKGRFTVEGSI